MKIVIRTRYINTFMVGFQSFMLFYPDKIGDLIVQVHSDNDDEAFKTMAKHYGFEVVFINHNNALYGNNWANMLYESLSYNDVVSFDDDLIFLKSGLFDYLDNIHKILNKKIIGTKYTTNSGIDIMHSNMISLRGATITKDDFTNLDEIQNYEGVDSALIYLNHKNDVEYLNNHLDIDVHPNKNFVKNSFYVHIGTVSYTWHIIRNEIEGSNNV